MALGEVGFWIERMPEQFSYVKAEIRLAVTG